jgi:hypothetical protein
MNDRSLNPGSNEGGGEVEFVGHKVSYRAEPNFYSIDTALYFPGDKKKSVLNKTDQSVEGSGRISKDKCNKICET